MHDDLTHAQKLRRDTGRKRGLRRLVVLVALALALYAAWTVLGDRVFFLASVDGVVVSKQIKRVTVNRGGQRSKESRYELTISDARGGVRDFTVAHDVFIQIEEGETVHKAPFSTQFTVE